MSQREKKKREERGARERDRYAEKRSVYGGLFSKKIKNARGLREPRDAALMLSLCFMDLMFISGEAGLEQVTHDAKRRRRRRGCSPP